MIGSSIPNLFGPFIQSLQVQVSLNSMKSEQEDIEQYVRSEQDHRVRAQ